KLAIILLAVSISGNLFSQDLLSKVPADSKIVVALNGEAFFKHANIEQLNGIFKRVGIFDKILEGNGTFQSENLQEFGIDMNSKSYIHWNVNDSLQLIGALIPLKDKTQFEASLPDNSEINILNGLNSIQSSDRTLLISWDEHTLYILGGMAMENYFSREDVRVKYGILENPSAYDYAEDATISSVPDTLDWESYDFDQEEVAIDSAKVIEETAIDSVKVVEEAESIEEQESEIFNIPPPAVPDDFESVDSVLERDEYQDDYYTQYSQVSAHNDSIKNIF